MKYFIPIILLLVGCTKPCVINDQDPINVACPCVVEHLDKVTDIKTLYVCFEYYQHFNGIDTPPGSWNTPLKIGLRILEVDPKDEYMYGAVAGIYYTKWALYQRGEVIKMADGADGLEKAYNLLLEGKNYNYDNTDYHEMAARTLFIISARHKPEYFPFVIESYNLVFLQSAYLKKKLDAAFQIAYIYHKFMGSPQEALMWYTKVLELASQHKGNPIADHYISAATRGLQLLSQ